jgi:hypothetical protein
MPLGMLLGGILTEQFGVRLLLISLGVTYLAATLSLAVIPTMRGLNRSAEALASPKLEMDSQV